MTYDDWKLQTQPYFEYDEDDEDEFDRLCDEADDKRKELIENQ